MIPEEKMPLVVTLSGCDDHTVIEIPVTAPELKFIRKVATKLNIASDYSCQPVMLLNDDDSCVSCGGKECGDRAAVCDKCRATQ